MASTVLYFLIRSILIRQLDEDLDIERKEMVAYVQTHDAFPEMPPVRHLQFMFIRQSQPFEGTVYRSFRAADSTDTDEDAFRALDFGVQVKGQYYKVSVMKPLESTESLLWSILVFVLAVILLLLASFYLINQTVLKKLWAPFFNSIHQLRNFSLAKNHSLQLSSSPVEEFRILNDTLEATTKKAQQDYVILKEFTENASHEMQTPLAIIRSKLDLLIQDEHLSESQSVVAQSVYASIQRLSRMNQSLLLLAKIGNSQFEELATVDMMEKVQGKMEAFQELWADEQIHVENNLSPVMVKMNVALADILLNNLFSNATKHNYTGGRILIDLRDDRLEIRNTGQDHPLDQSKLYQKFYTGKKDAGHTGLGLSIVKHICDASGFGISYHFEEGMHCFTILFGSVA